MEKILVIGCSGQIGSELVMTLRSIYGNENVYATDIKYPTDEVRDSGPGQILDVLDFQNLLHYIVRNNITQVYNLAAVLSGNAEKIPLQAWDINMKALINTILAAQQSDAKKLFWPSSIAVFGPTTPRHNTPQLTIMEPNTVYGISKLAGERWGEYYHQKYGIDFRSVRYPGLISYKTEAGGGTTDYAVEIFYEAIRHGRYECFLSADTALPMMFMDDAINNTIRLMQTPGENLTLRSSYNVAGISFTPKQLAESIKKYMPEFKISYKPDFRQAIANSWPASIDDSVARRDWGLTQEYDLDKMTKLMLEKVEEKLK
ncbi:MAG: NAD-dependent epimerase [Bacteroidetes bacterium CG18_big_fil_WC_8_21_14_2_50_41_14]|nr:MAG: NAD-dependent epimerase [Bacteroidetes bacterium CG18_big_fil_WC_8_21_14_2_50_41_14]PIY30824.1 MAG: NAD-dependent epimerase [Bacteroidetes bacterium CG_4_10_14_3_um_filter_42_6]PJB58832.1 MAG: NAD-dependent epimerase [Bacteroidetes bacterium CG_4_9_14_3_um_filter_41_19]